MKCELKKLEIFMNLMIVIFKKTKLTVINSAKIDIAIIKLIEFCQNMKKKSCEEFIINLYKINQIIEDKINSKTNNLNFKIELTKFKQLIFK